MTAKERAAKLLFGSPSELEVEAPAGWEDLEFKLPCANGPRTVTFNSLVAEIERGLPAQ